MSKWKIWVGLSVVLVSGILIGSVGTRLYIRHRISQFLTGERPVFRQLFMDRLLRELDLTDEQRRELEGIVDRTARSFRAIRRKHRAEVEALFDQAVSEMKTHLAPEQGNRLDAIRRRMMRFRPPPFPPPRHPPFFPPPARHGPGPGRGGQGPPSPPPAPPPDFPAGR